MTEYIDRAEAIKAVCRKCTACSVLTDRDDKAFSKAHCAEIRALQELPAADVVEVVRCKDCIHCNMEDENERWCLGWGSPARLVAPDSYCSRGIRKEGQR